LQPVAKAPEGAVQDLAETTTGAGQSRSVLECGNTLPLSYVRVETLQTIDWTPVRCHSQTMTRDFNRIMASINIVTCRSHHGLQAVLLALCFLSTGHEAMAVDWPEFRGPYGDGHVSAPGDQPIGLPLHWSDTENVKWKTPIPLRGWSTPVVMGGQVWLTTATIDGHDFYAIAVDAGTGKMLFDQHLFHADNPEPLGNGASMNCYATPSPVIEAGRVYVHFGRFGTACLDTATGQTLWKREDIQCRHYRGPSSSPVLFENLLILTLDGADVQYCIALDKQTGQTVWKTDRSVVWNDADVPGQMAKDGDLRKAHSTPLIVNANGKMQMLTGGAKAAYGYDPRTGKELWKIQYADWSVAPRPLFDQGTAFFVTGLMKTELWAVKTDGQGDVTDTKVLWKLKTHVGKYASPLLVDGLLYTASDESFVTCVDAATGETVWTERIGGKYAASPVYADGRLYFFSQEGTTTVLKPGRTFEALATNTLSGGFMASPAVGGKAFFLRTKTDLVRVESSSAGNP
jgi:outer membrane protein assembly factor BamB